MSPVIPGNSCKNCALCLRQIQLSRLKGQPEGQSLGDKTAMDIIKQGICRAGMFFNAGGQPKVSLGGKRAELRWALSRPELQEQKAQEARELIS
jgi:hypothetical protein